MIVQEIPGSTELRTLAEQAGVLRRALDAVRAAGGGAPESLEQAFAALLAWLRGEVVAGRLHADPPLRALLLALSGAPPRRTLAAALAGFGDGQALLARLQDLQDEIPFLFRVDSDGLPRLRTLGELVGHAPARLALSWSRRTAPADAALAFHVGAGADAGVALAVVDAATLQQRHQATLSPATDVALLVEATGSLRGEFRLGVPEGGLQASASQSLALAYEFPPGATALAALLHVPSRLPRGFGLAPLAAALALPGQDGLRQLSLTGESLLSFGLSSRRRGADIAIRSVHVQGRSRRIQRTVSTIGTLGVTLEDRAFRQRRVFREAGGALVLQSERRDDSARDSRLELDSGIRLTGWGSVAADLVAAALPDAAALLEQLAPLAQPQALLQRALRRRLPPALSGLAPVLTGEAQGRAATEALRAMVADALLSRFDLWRAVADDAVDGLAERIAGEFGGRFGALAEAELRGWLQRVLTDIAAAAREELQAFAAALAQRRQAQALARTLSALGIRVSRTARGAAALVEPLLAFLRAYGALRAKLVDAAKEALDLRLLLGVSWLREHADSDALEQELRVPADAFDTPAAAEDFRRWLLGHAFADPAQPFGVAAERVQGRWSAVATRYSELAETLTLDLGFSGIKARTLLESETRVEAGPGGVLLATTRTSAARTRSWGKDKVHAVGRALFDALSARDPLGRSSLDQRFTEAALSRTELDGVLASLSTPPVALLSAEAATALRAERDALAARHGGDPPVKLVLGMALGADQRRRLASLAADGTPLRRSIAQALAQAGSGRRTRNLVEAMQALGFAGNPVEAFVHHWEGLRRKLAGGPIENVTLNGWHITRSMRSSPLYRAAVQLKHCIAAAAAMEQVLRTLREWPDAASLAQRVRHELAAERGFAGLPEPAREARLASAMADAWDALGTEFAADFARALSSHDVLFDSSDDVPVFTLFVLILLASLSGARLKARLRSA